MTLSETSINFKQFIESCNKLNNSDKGIGNDLDNIDNIKDWKMYDITLDDKNFKLLGEKIDYSLIYRKLKGNGNTIFVIPGYSDKSIYWTVGRMNRFIKDYPNIFNQYRELYIINLQNTKPIQENIVNKSENKSEKREEFDNQIANHINKIINSLKKNITLLGRSAGGGQAIRVSILNDNIKSLFLASPGHKKSGFEEYLKTSKKIPIVLSYVEQDTRIKKEEIYKMKDQMHDNLYTPFTFLSINSNKVGDNHNHRFQPELIKML